MATNNFKKDSFPRFNRYNPIQINQNEERDGDNRVYKKSLLFTIRADTPEEGVEIYRSLKARLDGQVSAENSKKEEKSKSPECDLCGAPMLKRHSARGSFFGCSAFPRCRNTKQVEEIEGIRLEEILV